MGVLGIMGAATEAGVSFGSMATMAGVGAGVAGAATLGVAGEGVAGETGAGVMEATLGTAASATTGGAAFFHGCQSASPAAMPTRAVTRTGIFQALPAAGTAFAPVGFVALEDRGAAVPDASGASGIGTIIDIAAAAEAEGSSSRSATHSNCWSSVS